MLRFHIAISVFCETKKRVFTGKALKLGHKKKAKANYKFAGRAGLEVGTAFSPLRGHFIQQRLFPSGPAPVI
jgi:hypothetical protein